MSTVKFAGNILFFRYFELSGIWSWNLIFLITCNYLQPRRRSGVPVVFVLDPRRRPGARGRPEARGEALRGGLELGSIGRRGEEARRVRRHFGQKQAPPHRAKERHADRALSPELSSFRCDFSIFSTRALDEASYQKNRKSCLNQWWTVIPRKIHEYIHLQIQDTSTSKCHLFFKCHLPFRTNF